MPGAKKNFIGLEGFVWWIGVVEDRQDPEQLGRVRVRCFGWHTNEKDKVPTDALPWAHPVIPVNNPTAYTAKEGDHVFGFFMDGDQAQNPVIVGVLPGKPEKKPDYQKGFSDPGQNISSRPKKPDDSAEAYPKSKYLKEATTNRLSRGKSDGTVIATRKKNLKKNVKSAGGVTWSEPASTFAPKYPYNYALETESGHAFELDDTPNNERVHLAHKNGSYIEIDKDGNRTQRVQKDNYSVIMGDDFIYIKGKAAITVDGNFNLKTSTINIEASAINMAADGAIRIKGSTVNIESTGAMNFKSGGVGNFTSSGKLSLKGATAALAGASVDIPAAKIGLQSGSAATASGAGITGGGTQATAEEQAEVANTTPATANTVSANTTSDGLEEVTVTGKKIDPADAGKKTLLGKVVDGITSTVSAVASVIKDAANSVLKDFGSNMGLGELTAKVGNFVDNVNDNKGLITSLKLDLKNEVLNKIDEVGTKAIAKNIPFNIDSTITAEINNLKNVALNNLDVKIGKHIYPKTETVVANTSGDQ